MLNRLIKTTINRAKEGVSTEKINYNEENLSNLFILIQKNYGLGDEDLRDIKTQIINNFNKAPKGAIDNGVAIATIVFSYLVEKVINKNIGAQNLSKYTNEEIQIMEILSENAKRDPNPVVVYKGSDPLYWNPTMEKITGYNFSEIFEKRKNGEDIMELLYGYDKKELEKVKTALGGGKGYENVVFTLMAKYGVKHKIAWHTEMVGEYTIRRGSKNIYKILESLFQSHYALRDSMTGLMQQKDTYTSGHINRVVSICEIMGKKMQLDDYSSSQLKMNALLHDYGKIPIPDSILKKPGLLNEDEKIQINSHTGNGIFLALNNEWEEYTDGMAHHCFFYSPDGEELFTFKQLIKNYRDGKKVKPTDFNKLMGTNIPKTGRIISIGDVIDAIISRRIYSKFAGLPLNQILNYLTKELLDSTGLINVEGTIELDKNIWLETNNPEQIKLSYCIEFNGKHYIPEKNHKIQFDPNLLIKIYDNGILSKEIQEILYENDKKIVKDKLIEFDENIKILEDKQSNYNKLLGFGKNIDDSLIFTVYDEENLNRLRDNLSRLVKIAKDYEDKNNGQKILYL